MLWEESQPIPASLKKDIEDALTPREPVDEGYALQSAAAAIIAKDRLAGAVQNLVAELDTKGESHDPQPLDDAIAQCLTELHTWLEASVQAELNLLRSTVYQIYLHHRAQQSNIVIPTTVTPPGGNKRGS